MAIPNLITAVSILLLNSKDLGARGGGGWPAASGAENQHMWSTQRMQSYIIPFDTQHHQREEPLSPCYNAVSFLFEDVFQLQIKVENKSFTWEMKEKMKRKEDWKLHSSHLPLTCLINPSFFPFSSWSLRVSISNPWSFPSLCF